MTGPLRMRSARGSRTARTAPRAPASIPSLRDELAALARPRVALLRALPGLGDALCVTPALRALRAGLPRAEITLVGLPTSAWLTDRLPGYVDRVLPAPPWPGVPELPGDARATVSMLHALQAESFDAVIQLHGSGQATNALAALIGGTRVAGAYRRGLSRGDGPWFRAVDDREPEVIRWVSLVRWLGFPDPGTHLELPLLPADEEARRALSVEWDDRRYVVVHAGASIAPRRLRSTSFAAVCDAVAARGFVPVLTGTVAERDVVAAVAASVAPSTSVVDVSGRTSIGSLTALVSAATLVVSNDTGVAHVAAATRTPSVVVFVAGGGERWAPLDRVLHRPVGLTTAPARAGHCCLGEDCPHRWASAVSPDHLERALLEAVHAQLATASDASGTTAWTASAS